MNYNINNINNINLSNIIKDYFNETPYFDLYNLDIWISIVIIFIVLIIVIYFFTINTLQNQKINFEKNKCNPLFMPFASTLNPEYADDPSFVQNNLKECLNNTNYNIALEVTSPLDGFFNSIMNFFKYLGELIAKFISFLMYLLQLLYKIYELVIERLRIILSSINNLFIGIGDFFNHILGLIANLYYTIILLVDSLKYVFTIIALSFFIMALIPAIISCSISFVIMMTALITAVSMGWLFPPFAPFSMMWLFGIFGTTLVTFLISLAIVIIFTLLYNILGNFAAEIIENGPRLSLPTTGGPDSVPQYPAPTNTEDCT
tara:strand:+ start:1454 stop:2407 length:954 start_codon:yes stop_codon:yes gene_type:complete